MKKYQLKIAVLTDDVTVYANDTDDTITGIWNWRGQTSRIELTRGYESNPQPDTIIRYDAEAIAAITSVMAHLNYLGICKDLNAAKKWAQHPSPLFAPDWEIIYLEPQRHNQP